MKQLSFLADWLNLGFNFLKKNFNSPRIEDNNCKKFSLINMNFDNKKHNIRHYYYFTT